MKPPKPYFSGPMKAFSQSIGMGKTIVEFFSAAISVRVCR
jgi:hypothetical protein